MIQWLGLQIFTAKGAGSTPVGEPRSCTKKRKKKKELRISYRDPDTGHSNATVTSEGLNLQSQTWSRREVNNYIQRVVNQDWG